MKAAAASERAELEEHIASMREAVAVAASTVSDSKVEADGLREELARARSRCEEAAAEATASHQVRCCRSHRWGASGLYIKRVLGGVRHTPPWKHSTTRF